MVFEELERLDDCVGDAVPPGATPRFPECGEEPENSD
jgi:hypothetical protein